jgi:hypothetical protein
MKLRNYKNLYSQGNEEIGYVLLTYDTAYSRSLLVTFWWIMGLHEPEV